LSSPLPCLSFLSSCPPAPPLLPPFPTRRSSDLDEEARETADVKAKEVLATTIQRLAPDYTVETAVSVVDLPSDDMKGRIIGRERSEEHTSELQSRFDLVCRLLLEKKKKKKQIAKIFDPGNFCAIVNAITP